MQCFRCTLRSPFTKPWTTYALALIQILLQTKGCGGDLWICEFASRVPIHRLVKFTSSGSLVGSVIPPPPPLNVPACVVVCRVLASSCSSGVIILGFGVHWHQALFALLGWSVVPSFFSLFQLTCFCLVAVFSPIFHPPRTCTGLAPLPFVSLRSAIHPRDGSNAGQFTNVCFAVSSALLLRCKYIDKGTYLFCAGNCERVRRWVWVGSFSKTGSYCIISISLQTSRCSQQLLGYPSLLFRGVLPSTLLFAHTWLHLTIRLNYKQSRPITSVVR